MKELYRIESKDGVVVRKKATRPYVVGYVKRDEEGALVTAHTFSTNPNLKLNPFYEAKGFQLEALVAVKI